MVESCAGPGSAEAKAGLASQHPHRAEVLTELNAVPRRACLHRPRRPASAHSALLQAGRSLALEHGAQRGAEAWKAQGLLEVRSEISDKNLPDASGYGPSPRPEAIDALKAQVMDPDVQVVVSDGLSTDAITANYEARSCRRLRA